MSPFFNCCICKKKDLQHITHTHTHIAHIQNATSLLQPWRVWLLLPSSIPTCGCQKSFSHKHLCNKGRPHNPKVIRQFSRQHLSLLQLGDAYAQMHLISLYPLAIDQCPIRASVLQNYSAPVISDQHTVTVGHQLGVGYTQTTICER